MLVRSLAIACMLVITGCATVDPDALLARNAGLEIEVVSSNWSIVKAAAKGDPAVNLVFTKLGSTTRDKLARYGITAYLSPHPDAARIRYDIVSISFKYRNIGAGLALIGKNNFSVRYRVTLESPDGKVLWGAGDEENDSRLDDIFDAISCKVARDVSRYFAETD